MPTTRHDFRYRTPQDDGELAAYGRLLSLAFGRPPAESFDWARKLERADVRLLSQSGTMHPVWAHPPGEPFKIGDIEADPAVCAGLLLIPMGQFFNGVSIPLVGVAGVAVGPETRGRGIATSLMKHAMLELSHNSVPLSGLYAATHRLYRSVGYEQAGHRFEGRIPLWRLSELMSRKPDGASHLVVRPAAPGDRPAIQAAYSRLAAANNGFLDRGPYVWSRIYAAGAEPTRGFVLIDPKADEDERVQGWVFLSQPEAPRPPLPAASGPRKHEVFLHDFGATTPAAASKLWAFLAGFATIATDLVFFGGPSHPMLMLLPEQVYSLSLRDHWMIRLTNMPAALKARAYPRGLSIKLHLDIDDPVIPENSGRFTLDIDDGQAAVRKGGKGELRIDINTLAALYSGYLAPSQLAQVGRIEGTSGALAAAGGVFAPTTGTPSMPDMY